MRTPHGRCRRMGPAAALAVSLVLVAAARAAAPPPDEQENPYLWKPLSLIHISEPTRPY